ncbi:MAG: hypothetical protein WD267_09300 [Balneolales bacterium]
MSIFKTFLLSLVLFNCSGRAEQAEGDFENVAVNEQKRELSEFKVYRGNTHGHTIFTWGHGWHRGSETTFDPNYNVPEGMDAADHTTISMNPADYTNQQGLPANHYERAKANGYDFYVTTDHSQEPTLQPVSIDNTFWQTTLKHARTYDNDPDFVALAGIEFSRNTPDNGGNGHINPINIAEYVNADHRDGTPAWPEANWSIPQFYDWLKTVEPNGEGYVAASFNHPGINQYDDWANLDEDIVDKITMFELHTNYRGFRFKPFIRALNKGWKVSPVGAHDNHGFGPIDGADQPPPTLLLAPELTKVAITRAMSQRRTYVSWIEGTELRYSVNDFIMGSTLDRADTYKFQIEIKTPKSDTGNRIRRIQILRNHPDGEDDVVVVAEAEFDGDMDEVKWSPTIEDPTAKYFLLSVHHGTDITDGEYNNRASTYSGPVWTGK